MPYIEGETLRRRLEREGALPIEETVRIVRDVGDRWTTLMARALSIATSNRRTCSLPPATYC